MFSPYERVYNTPDVSVPAAEAILQQLRLERILKRFGYFACYKPVQQTYDTVVAPPLVTLGPPAPLRRLRPFGAHEAFTGWQQSKTVQIPKPKVCPRVPKSGISRSTLNDPNLPHQRGPAGGSKYDGVHLPKYGPQEDIQRPDLFKPFQPLKSPQRLPALQRERSKQYETKLQVTGLYKKLNKDINTNLKQPRVKEGKERKKRRKAEMDFMKWEASHEQYFDKSVTDLHDYVSSRDNTVHVNNGAEHKYREQIETQIKRGVRQRVDSFGTGGKMLRKATPKRNVLPVLELEFENKNVRTKHVKK